MRDRTERPVGNAHAHRVRMLNIGLLWACLIWPWLGNSVAAQGFAGLGTEAQDYAQVTPDVALTFPRDHLAHPGFRIEWWYVTANLVAADGTEMGLQWTLFRQAGAPGDTAQGWQSAQVWMGHAAVTTPDAHYVAERFARGGIGQAGVSGSPFVAWIDDWELAGDSFDDRLRLSASGDGFSYAVELQAQGPLVLHGEQGVSVKSSGGQASYYYSQPNFALEGTVMLGAQTHTVTGRAWLDREWSSQPLSGTQSGWDWFALHLPEGEKLMMFRLRDAEAGHYTSGTWIASDGEPTPLENGAARFEPLATSQVEGRAIPTRWRLQLPERGLDITTEAVNDQSYMTTAFPYWEGPIRFSGSHSGVGYLEMTGY
ncbi:MAG: lipocalin-like domain-containing protein [Pseudomonadota bacterium]